MKLKRILGVLTVMFFINSCIEHEVIPPPRPVVDLACSFNATIDGSNYNLIENVSGLFCDPTKAKEILPQPQPSSSIYFASIRSNSAMDFIQVGIGKIFFNADVNSDPSKEQFETFLNSNLNPEFKAEANNGIEIIFRDPSGNLWKSDPNSSDSQAFVFNGMEFESDDNGDYAKFSASFSCTLYRELEDTIASLRMENATYNGYFKR
jgi:hypothetical protein